MKAFLSIKIDRLAILVMIAIMVLILFLHGWSAKARRSALESAQQLTECQNFASKIQELQQKPDLVAVDLRSTSQIAKSVEDSMTKAEINPQSLIRIEPSPLRRIEKSPFARQPINIEVRDITMEQMIRFLFFLSTDHQLQTSDMRLHAPQSAQNVQETWNAELVLSNILFAP